MAKPTNGKVFFYGLFVFVILLSYLVLKPYINLLLVAFIFAVLFGPLYDRFLKVVKGNQGVATMLTLVIFLLVVFIPLIMIVSVTVKQTITFYHDVENFIQGNNVTIDKVVDITNETLDKLPYINRQISKDDILKVLQDNIQPAVNFAFNNAINVGKTLFDSIPKFVIFIILFSGLIPAQKKFLGFIENVSPLDSSIDKMLINRFLAMSQSMLKGSIIIGIAQGIVSGIALSIAGVPYVFFWTLIITFLSIIPLGAGFINPPIGIVLILLGNVWGGILVLVNHFIVVTNIDNLLRPRLVSKDAQLHPILTLLGALGGLALFGFWGVIFGPVVMILLVTMFEVYLTHYRNIPVLKTKEIAKKK